MSETEYRARDARYKRKRYTDDPEYRARKLEYNRQYMSEYRQTPEYQEKMAEYSRKRNYGVPLGWFESQLKRQNGACAICGTTEPQGKKPWAIDHCHDTKVVRKILCCKCNLMLGHAKDNPETLRAAAEYLETFDKPLTTPIK